MNKLLLKSKNLLKIQNYKKSSTNYQKFSNLEDMNNYLNNEKPAKHVVLITSEWNPLYNNKM